MTHMLTCAITALLDEKMQDFFGVLSEKYQIPLCDLKKLWDTQESSRISQEPPQKQDNKQSSKVREQKPDTKGAHTTETKEPEPKEPEPKEPEPKKVANTVCPHILTRGKNAGNVCGKKPIKGCSHCKRHQKSVTKEEIKTPKPVEGHILRKGPDDTYLHRATGLLFRISEKEKIVVGQISTDGKELEPLTQEGVACAIKHDFKYKKSVSFQEEVSKVMNAPDEQEDIMSVLDKLQLLEDKSGEDKSGEDESGEDESGEKSRDVSAEKSAKENLDDTEVSSDEVVSFTDLNGDVSEQDGGLEDQEPLEEEA